MCPYGIGTEPRATMTCVMLGGHPVSASEGPPTRPDAERPPRERLVRSAADLIRQRGVSAASLRDIVAHAGAPRGSLQHYFPNGKDELVAEALAWMGGVAARHAWRHADALAPATPSNLLKAMVDEWRSLFLTSGFERGCPLVAASADVVAWNEELRATVRQAFDRWLDPVATALTEMGVPAERSAALAVLMISALEGAIVLARARHDVSPLDALVAELGPLLDGAVSRSRRRRTMRASLSAG